MGISSYTNDSGEQTPACPHCDRCAFLHRNHIPHPFEFNLERELLLKGWMTHDAMWFYHCLHAIGIEATNEINIAAIRSMASIETKRLKRAFGILDLDSFEKVRYFLQCAFSLYSDEFMGFQFGFPEYNLMCGTTTRCFAHEGISRLGVMEQYQCGLIPRVKGWLDAAGVVYEHQPSETRCLKGINEKCYHTFRFFFP